MAWDRKWEKVFQQKEWGKYPAECLVRFIARNFYTRDRKGTKILELGCGTGPNIWYMAREGFEVYGIDGSRSAIVRARERIKSEGLKASLWVGDIINLPWQDNYFDAVVDNECVYSNSTEDSQRIFSEVNRVLKKDGLFYSRTFSDDMYIGKSQKRLGDLEYTNISDGPLSVGKAFARLIDKKRIHRLYGNFFKVVSVDKLQYTRDNGLITISEWIIICQNKD